MNNKMMNAKISSKHDNMHTSDEYYVLKSYKNNNAFIVHNLFVPFFSVTTFYHRNPSYTSIYHILS